ncbi:MAG: class I SAM-dependent methyltransferase [Chloroflexi bacterium]|nr:MAG: class I SAM-dependent methyltransferase [Chloroflexota bacterium]
MTTAKTSTDQHWSQRAASVANDAEVNLMDVFQRDLEYDHVCQHLTPGMTALEVGCGNGYSTLRFRELVKHIDAMDYSEEMIERARARVGETNNTFIVDDIRAPRHLRGPYDTVICVRVLINLADLEEQRLAFRSMAAATRPGGLLILVEGYRDGSPVCSRTSSRYGTGSISAAMTSSPGLSIRCSSVQKTSATTRNSASAPKRSLANSTLMISSRSRGSKASF